ncbi:GMC family oxidoreductase [Pseudooceanicola sp. CBS1P-1]|uniref:GMC family oxidoreductase n=1 Tax=Pseudooceanicola albus TaxID=2692189 RepID=A0A6L7G3U7_9RHOB|nr:MULTISPECIES: GMC family oxidoreductase [Pseudooceanicola]MBT9385159.1 GMC family oxidoreductase [Pseudooceanicola endophyticus]MXN18549.1 GMC family oxidoreductase [Pseudooceanicola albus]
MSRTRYDAVVIGSGPTGSFAVKELTEQGLNVLLLEAGPEVGPEAFDPNRKKPPQSDINIWERARATLKGQPVQARAAFFSEKLAHLYVNDRQNPYTTPKDAPFLWIRGKQSGGRMHTFGRVLLRWTDDDFKLKTRTGKGADWPIRYDDIAPFYDEVEGFLGLYGQKDDIPTFPDGVYAHEAQLNPAETRFKTDLEALWPNRRVTTWRYIATEPERVPSPLRAALATGRLSVRYDSIARKVLTDPETGRATGVELLDAKTRAVETVEADAVVLCASAIESVRLMLNSTSEAHPQGLGNSSGTLGRYFMDQLPCLAVGSYSRAKGWTLDTASPEDPFYPPSGGAFIPRFVAPDGSAESLYDFQATVGRIPVPEDQDARFSVFGFGQMMPAPENRVTLDPGRKDAWGIPVPHIRCKMAPEDEALLAEQEETLIDMAEKTGAKLEFIGSPNGLREMGRGAYPDADAFSRFIFRKWFARTMVMGAAIHETGGARMGEDPAASVLDGMNRCWDAPNLLVTDASAFCTSGVTGTTLTAMALTVRACRALAADLKQG